MRPCLIVAFVFLVAGCSSEPCAGVACDACPPAIQLDVRTGSSSEPVVSGPVALVCEAQAGGWRCHASSAPAGRYAFDVTIGGETRSVTVELRPAGAGCCACGTVSEIGVVDFGADRADGGLDGGPVETDGGARDAAASDAASADAAANDGGVRDDAGERGDAGACAPELVEFPMGGELQPGTLCDDVFACVPAAAVASVEATTVFECGGVSELPCAAGERACRYADPGGPSTLDEAEIASICALTVHAPPPSRVVCRVYL